MIKETPFERLKKLGLIKVEYKKFEIKEEKQPRTVLVGRCPFCEGSEKKVWGVTQAQLDWNLVLHLRQKHKDNEEAEILIKQIEEQQKAIAAS